MDDSSKLSLFDEMINYDSNIKAEIILSLLRNTKKYNVDTKTTIDMAKTLKKIKDRDKLDCIKKIVNLENSLKNNKILDLTEIVIEAQAKDNVTAIYNLLKTKYIASNKHIVELAKIMNKDKPLNILDIAIDAAKKLSITESKKIVELTSIVADSVNYESACLANLVVTTEEIASFPNIEELATIISKCEDEEKANEIYNISQNINELSKLCGEEITINIIKNVSKENNSNKHTRKLTKNDSKR